MNRYIRLFTGILCLTILTAGQNLGFGQEKLKAITVTGKASGKKSSVERTTINVGANIAASAGTALDILSSSSAVTVGKNSISIRGNSNVNILIDGRPTTFDNLAAIPAANIKNIEIITNPDASYDSDGTGGIINIISRKEKASGLSGVVSANYGFNHFVAANAALSYNNEKASYRFNYNTRYEDDLIEGTLERKIFAAATQTSQQMKSNRYVFNTNIGIGTDIRLNKRNILGIDINLLVPRLNITQDLHNRHIQGSASTQENRHNDVTWNRENIEGAISYRKIFKPEVSDLILRGSVSKIWGHRPSFYYLDDTLVNKSNSGGSPFMAVLQGDYTRKFKKGTLTAGAKLLYRGNEIYHEFYSENKGNWEYSNQFSNDLTHKVTVPSAYAMFASPAGKRFSYKVGARVEYSYLTIESRHENLSKDIPDLFFAPNLSAAYKISGRQDISFAFSRRIARPTYPQLNPYMSMVDATTFEQGNMKLMPEKGTMADLAYSLKGRIAQLFINGYANYVENYITQITTVNDNLLITTYINTPEDFRYGADVSLKITPAGWMDLTLNSNTYKVKISGEQKGMDISNGGWVNSSNILWNIMPARMTDIQLQYFIQSPQYFAQLTTDANHYMDIAVRQKLLEGKIALTASLTDVFKTKEWTIHSSNNIFEMTNHSINKSRMLWLGITWNFNSFKQKKQEKKGEPDRSLIRLGF